MATQEAASSGAHVGDWIMTRGIYGQPPRRGQNIALLGRDRHERYRVRWDENHESILYPADGVVTIRRRRAARHANR